MPRSRERRKRPTGAGEKRANVPKNTLAHSNIYKALRSQGRIEQNTNEADRGSTILGGNLRLASAKNSMPEDVNPDVA